MNSRASVDCTRTAVLLSFVLMVAGCRTPPPMLPVDLSQAGWRIQQGQAVWKPSSHRSELAGDLMIATNVDGNFFVQLTKTPFPLVTAERKDDQWQIKFGADEHAWRGRGVPPSRFVWFQLPAALREGAATGNWHFENLATNAWRLENKQTGETLEGGFFP